MKEALLGKRYEIPAALLLALLFSGTAVALVVFPYEKPDIERAPDVTIHSGGRATVRVKVRNVGLADSFTGELKNLPPEVTVVTSPNVPIMEGETKTLEFTLSAGEFEENFDTNITAVIKALGSGFTDEVSIRLHGIGEPKPPPPASKGDLLVRVFTGTGTVKGALVQINGLYDTTDGTGQVVFVDLPAGDYRVRVSKDSLEVSTSVTVKPDVMNEVSVKMSKPKISKPFPAISVVVIISATVTIIAALYWLRR